MFGLSSRSGQRKEPTWTQTPSSNAQAEPVWRDVAASAPAYEPTRQQTGSPSQPSSKSYTRLWISAVVGVAGLLAVAYLFLSMVNVVEEQVARNQQQSVPVQGNTGMTLVSSPAGR